DVGVTPSPQSGVVVPLMALAIQSLSGVPENDAQIIIRASLLVSADHWLAMATAPEPVRLAAESWTNCGVSVPASTPLPDARMTQQRLPEEGVMTVPVLPVVWRREASD